MELLRLTFNCLLSIVEAYEEALVLDGRAVLFLEEFLLVLKVEETFEILEQLILRASFTHQL